MSSPLATSRQCQHDPRSNAGVFYIVAKRLMLSSGRKQLKNVENCIKFKKRSCYVLFKKIIIAIVALIVIGGVASAMGGDEKAATTTSAPASSTANTSTTTTTTTTTQQPKAAPMVVTADKLVEDLKSNALNASETYKSKYVEVTGQLSNIDSGGKYFSIEPMDGSFNLTNVMCNITQEQKATVAKFTSKQKVTVIGTITDVGEVMGYTIKVESIK